MKTPDVPTKDHLTKVVFELTHFEGKLKTTNENEDDGSILAVLTNCLSELVFERLWLCLLKLTSTHLDPLTFLLFIQADAGLEI